MEFKTEKNELNFIQGQLSDEPCINVISKHDFEKRVKLVYDILWNTLSKSFGPGGAGTFISVYPHYYNTKDGFSIMKNIAFDKKLDQVICDMVMDICSRLNFTVGDGTTTAVIATKSVYDSYLNNKNELDEMNILPREILNIFEKYKDILLNKIDELSSPIRSTNPDELYENIKKVVYISSNGNKEITEMIASLYKDLMYPAISCVLSKDGIMKSSIIEGYKIDVSLTDKLYINNDSNTMSLNGSDIIMFDHKITKDTYEKILRPLSQASKSRGRHLLCIAPYYDETALSGPIRTDLNLEYKKSNDINLVLSVCSKITSQSKVSLDDLAMLLNTVLISPSMEDDMLAKLTLNNNIYQIFDMDNRGIPNINVAVYSDDENDHTLRLVPYQNNLKNVFGECYKDSNLRLGYCDKLELGLKESTFSGFYYDKEVYSKYLSTAKDELEEIKRKCETIGTFSLELTQKQQRVHSLGLKTGLIEVGATSEISQGYLKDIVDDAVKAAASAYNNGVVLGCNVTLMGAISTVLKSLDDNNKTDKIVLKMLFDGYMSVYKTVLANVLCNDYKVTNDNITIDCNNLCINIPKCKYQNIVFPNLNTKFEDSTSLIDYITHYSVYTQTVFDLSKGEFNNEVINSVETDKEILKATLDLLSLLITGNQLVLR